MKKSILIFSLFFFSLAVYGVSGPQKSKFRAGREMNFDSQLVEGQIYRPDLSVITGDVALGGLGVLRLRTDLRDRVQQQSAKQGTPTMTRTSR